MSVDTATLHVRNQYCNIYGGEWDGGAKAVLGGIGPQTPSVQWYCETRAVARYYMECAHGHRGSLMYLCRKHYHQYQDKVEFCPRCNDKDDHRCKVTIHEKS